MTSSPEKPNPVDGARERLEACVALEAEMYSFVSVEKTDLTLLLADHAKLREALEEINRVGTKNLTQRVGDMYDPAGWQDYEVVSEEADIARVALGDQSK